MKCFFCFLIIFVNLPFWGLAQNDTTEVVEMTLKLLPLAGKKVYYGFEEGDKIIFSIEILGGDELTELSIKQYPDTDRFNDLNISRITNKQIAVSKQGVYCFCFKNKKFKPVTCKIKIQRIPISKSAIDFNTQVIWETVRDTTYSKSQTKKIAITDEIPPFVSPEMRLIKIDTQAIQITENNEIVHSWTKLGADNVSYINFVLPESTKTQQISEHQYRQEEYISWAYNINVDNSQNKENIQQANKKAMALGKAAIAVVAPSHTAIATLALYGISYFMPPPLNSDNILYEIMSSDFDFNDSGNSAFVAKKISKYTSGKYIIKLTNDNFRTGINVNVSIYAVKLIRTYSQKSVSNKKSKRYKEVPKMIIRVKKMPKIVSTKAPGF